MALIYGLHPPNMQFCSHSLSPLARHHLGCWEQQEGSFNTIKMQFMASFFSVKHKFRECFSRGVSKSIDPTPGLLRDKKRFP